LPRANESLEALFNQLAEQDYSQAQIAGAIGVAPQYISDIRCGRRPLTELVARRIGEKFHVDYRTLMGLDKSLQPGLTLGPSTNDAWLPILPHPVQGEPTQHPRWNGTYVQVPALAASKLVGAVHPFVLRFGNDDCENRLHKNDLVLISQSPNEKAQISVVRSGRKCFLCRRNGSGWVRVANGQVLTGNCVVVGHCIGVLWSALA
jgi:transcriptional regulator with XRE-family HTH domain